MNNYVKSVLNDLKKKYPWQDEFIQAATEVLESLSVVFDKDDKYEKAHILERIIEPERIIKFRVPWQDDEGNYHVNRGFRVQFNSAIGPYKGGLRFHPSVNESILKFLGFEQIFKNSLTGIPMGGGKGGSDFDPRGKSDDEIMRFCQSFMTELFRHIGAYTDVPAGDIGVGGREIGYLFGQYKRLANEWTGVLTGKDHKWGGSLIRPEATGFGATYFAEEMLKANNDSLEGKKVALSGFGNVAWGAAQKVTELGGKVITLSGPDGFIYDPEGVGTEEKWDYMLEMRASGRDKVKDYADKFGVDFFKGKTPWKREEIDIAIPAATQNEFHEDDAKALVKNGAIALAEAANMPCTLEAMKILQKSDILYAPGKAVNAGGVATSGLEMAQNSQFIFWTEEKVEQELHKIMVNIHKSCLEASKEYNLGSDYVAGANIAGFKKVADSMIEQGHV